MRSLEQGRTYRHQAIAPGTAITNEPIVGVIAPPLSARTVAIALDDLASDRVVLDLRRKVRAWILLVDPSPHPSTTSIVMWTTQGDQSVHVIKPAIGVPQKWSVTEVQASHHAARTVADQGDLPGGRLLRSTAYRSVKSVQEVGPTCARDAPDPVVDVRVYDPNGLAGDFDQGVTHRPIDAGEAHESAKDDNGLLVARMRLRAPVFFYFRHACSLRGQAAVA